MPAEDTDFEAYLRFLYERDIAPAVQRYRLELRPRPFDSDYENFEYPLSRLARANSVLRLANNSPDLYETFRPSAITQTLQDASAGAGMHSEMANRLGFAELLDSDFLTIARRMTPEMLPPEEAELLRQFGFPDVAESLAGMVHVARQHAETASTQFQEVRPSRAMSKVAETLEPAINDHKRIEQLEEEIAAIRQQSQVVSNQEIQRLQRQINAGRKPRRWWNAIRKIVQGTAASLADIAVAVGVGTTVAPPAWLTILSVVSGVSTLTEAADDLRREA